MPYPLSLGHMFLSNSLTFSIVCLLLVTYLQRSFPLPITCLSTVTSIKVLAILITYLHAQAISLYSFLVAFILYISFLHFSSVKGFLFSRTVPLLWMPFLQVRMNTSCDLKKLSSKVDPLSWNSFYPSCQPPCRICLVNFLNNKFCSLEKPAIGAFLPDA